MPQTRSNSKKPKITARKAVLTGLPRISSKRYLTARPTAVARRGAIPTAAPKTAANRALQVKAKAYRTAFVKTSPRVLRVKSAKLALRS